jgi:peptidyl-prolyl cis-trans isomerase SurA
MTWLSRFRRARFERTGMCRPGLCGLLAGMLGAGVLSIGVLGGGAAVAQVKPAPATRPAAAAPAKPMAPTKPMALAPSNGAAIVAVVNGDVISQTDVDNRRRLFALSTGLPVTQEILDRLTPQVTLQLIDERLRLQEIQRRHIIVTDKEIADAITEVEHRNGMQPGMLRQRLTAAGVGVSTLIDQIRVQIGWTRVLREVLGERMQVSDADIKAQQDILKAQTGQPEYQVSEIFVQANDPSQLADASRFAETVITQLRAGAPFAMMAAEFSQSQTALAGGDLGWVQPNELDPAVLRVLQEMPVGAVSNPIRVPGGFSIVTLRAKREIGQDPATVLSVRQIFFRFGSPLDPNHPTPQQQQALARARQVAATAKSCADMEAAARAEGDPKGGDPGPVRLNAVGVPALRQVMATLPLQTASQPLVAEDGAAVVMVCSREQQNLGIPSRQELTERILNERADLVSRQLMLALHRRALIDVRS